MQTEYTSRDARAYFADMINLSSVHGRIIYITSKGRRVAAIVPLHIAEAADPEQEQRP